MSREIHAYQIELQLYERDDPQSDWHKSDSEPDTFITVSTTLALACDFVAAEFMRQDETDRSQFEWRSVCGFKLNGRVIWKT